MATRQEELRKRSLARQARIPNDPNRPVRDPLLEAGQEVVEFFRDNKASPEQVDRVNRRAAAQRKSFTPPPPPNPNEGVPEFLDETTDPVNPRGARQRVRNPEFARPKPPLNPRARAAQAMRRPPEQGPPAPPPAPTGDQSVEEQQFQSFSEGEGSFRLQGDQRIVDEGALPEGAGFETGMNRAQLVQLENIQRRLAAGEIDEVTANRESNALVSGTQHQDLLGDGGPAVPANVGQSAGQTVRPAAPRPPEDPEGIEVIRGTRRSFQGFNEQGSTQGVAEFGLTPGRSLAESREAAAFGDPNFQAQQESRQADLTAQGNADRGTAAIVNSVANSGTFGFAGDGRLNFNVINPETGQFEATNISPFVAEAITSPDEFETQLVDDGVGGQQMVMVNTSQGTTEVVSLKTDSQAAVTAMFQELVKANQKENPDDKEKAFADAREEIEEEFGSFFLDYSFLGDQ